MGNNNSYLRRKKLRENPNSNGSNESTNSDVEKGLKYYLSNCYEDLDRGHTHHFFKKYLYQNNFSSPIEERLMQGRCKVLDIGCGPGTWLLDLAHKYEKSYFYGLDINPVYPNEIKPGNLEFIKADMFNGLPFPDNEFDFVHQETMLFIIKANQWNFIISEMIRVTKPGGYIELLESYGTFKGIGPVLSKLHGAHTVSSLQRGVDMKLLPNLDKIIMLNRNTPKVYREDRVYVMGPNGGKIGMINQDIFMRFHDNEAAIDNLSSVLGISKEEYRNMITKDLIEELKHTNPEYMFIRFWAQKEINININNNNNSINII